jgi:hypothetical protein
METDTDSREIREEIENPANPAVTVETPTERRVAALKPFMWKPGETGNAGGRLSHLARRVRQATRDGRDLVAFLVKVMNNPKERTRDRLHAAELLLSRGWGKALQRLELTGQIEEHGYRVNLLAVATAAELDALEGHLAAEQRLLDVIAGRVGTTPAAELGPEAA